MSIKICPRCGGSLVYNFEDGWKCMLCGRVTVPEQMPDWIRKEIEKKNKGHRMGQPSKRR